MAHIKIKIGVLAALLFLAVIGIVLFSGCIDETQQKQNLTEKKTRMFTDDLNRTVEIPKNPERIVAVASADIEILFLLNASDRIVGRPTHQRYPPEALKIDDIGGMYPMSLEKIVAKQPDLVIVTMTFKKDYIKQIEQLETYNITALGFHYPDLMSEILRHIEVIGEITGRKREAENVVKDMNKRIEKIAKKTSKLHEDQKPTVYCEWNRGKTGWSFGNGSRCDELIRIAGGKNIFSDVKKTSFEANFEDVISRNPGVIIITADLDKFKQDELKKAIEARPGWKNIDAVKNNRVCIVAQEITWANPRIIQGLEEFARCIHPELFEK